MSMIIPDFLLFTFYAVQNAYLPLFLRNLGYSASQIGFLYAIFNIAGIIIPLLLTPYIAKKNIYSLSLFIQGLVLFLIPVPMFRITGFVYTAVSMAIYAVSYKLVVPLSDSLITQSLGDHKERYGFIRVWGSIGFVLMALLMQMYCDVDTVSVNGMILWMSVPAFLFTVAVFVRMLFVKKDGTDNGSSSNQTEDEEHTLDILKSFGFPFYLMMGVVFFEFVGMVPANNFLSLYVMEKLHVNSAGFLWALSAACEIPFMFFSVFIIRKAGEEKLLLICTASVTLRNLFYAFIPNIYGAVFGQMLHSLTYGVFFPAGVMFCSKAAKGKIKATLLATTMFNTFYGLASVLGTAVGGVIVDMFGYFTLFISFGICPSVSVICYLIIKRLRTCRV